MFTLFSKIKKYDHLNATEFESRSSREKTAVVLDVRTSAEFSNGHLPGAINLNLLSVAFSSTVAKLSKERIYYVYCRSGNRSADACAILSDRGFKVYNLTGGISTWKGRVV